MAERYNARNVHLPRLMAEAFLNLKTSSLRRVRSLLTNLEYVSSCVIERKPENVGGRAGTGASWSSSSGPEKAGSVT